MKLISKIIDNCNFLSEGLLPCIKQPVYAMLRTVRSEETFGSNVMKTSPGLTCPREDLGMVSGEGYHLCKEKCSQEFHAETQALDRAKDQGLTIEGSTIYLTGHFYCCPDCIQKMTNAGVSNVIFLDTDKELDLK